MYHTCGLNWIVLISSRLISLDILKPYGFTVIRPLIREFGAVENEFEHYSQFCGICVGSYEKENFLVFNHFELEYGYCNNLDSIDDEVSKYGVAFAKNIHIASHDQA